MYKQKNFADTRRSKEVKKCKVRETRPSGGKNKRKLGGLHMADGSSQKANKTQRQSLFPEIQRNLYIYKSLFDTMRSPTEDSHYFPPVCGPTM